MQRAPLQRRTEDLQLAKHVNLRQVVSGLDQGAYFCKVCDCHLRDSANYLAHINGRKHNRMLGMSMRAERSTLGEVKARLEAHKADRDAAVKLTNEEKAASFLEQFDERLRQREEEAIQEAAEKRRAARARLQQTGEASGSVDGEEEEAVGEGDSGSAFAVPDGDAEAMAMMGFGSFGGSRREV